MRRIAKWLFYQMGGLKYLQFANRKNVRILMYHSIGSVEPNFFPEDMSLPAQAFVSQMRYCREHYNPISLSEFVGRQRQGRVLPERAVIVTIDDGFKNCFTTAFPILREYQIPATVFPISNWVFDRRMCWLHRFFYLLSKVAIGCIANALAAEVKVTLPQITNQLHERVMVEQVKDILKYKVFNKHELLDHLYVQLDVDIPAGFADTLYLSADDLYVMSKNGIEIGSHGCTHSPVSTLNPKQLIEELTKSKLMLEDCIGKEVRSFAYPFGSTRDLGDVRHILKESGYQCAVTSRFGLVNSTDDIYMLNRCKVAGDEDSIWEEVLGVELSPWLKR